MADVKGKGKARLEPIDLSSDEDEDPLAMFTMKTTFKGLGRIDDKRNEVIVSDHSAEEDDEDEDVSKAKRKKKKPAKKPPPLLPEWTRSISAGSGRRPHKRSSTESRRSGERSELIVISSDDEGQPRKSKGKGKERESDRARIALTPPPALSKEEEEREKARFLAHVKQRTELEPLLIDDDDEPVITRATTSSKPGRPIIKVYVTMMTDKTKLPADASARAIKEWEKRRNITIYQNAKIADLFAAVATSVQRSPDDIELVYDDQRIKYRNMSAKQLLINDGSYLIGYAKDHWERIDRAKQEELDSLRGQIRQTTPPIDTLPASASPAPIKKIKICLQGAWGSTKFGVIPEVTGLALAELYCEKNQKDIKIARTLKLYFDGELIGVEATAEQIDLDDGDLVDVMIPEAYR